MVILRTKYQKFLIASEVETILQKCDVIANNEYEELKEQKELIDNTCPKCFSKKENIVNKISNVTGKAELSGSFTIKATINIQTEPVNHCNKCGNEWEKFKIKYISKTDILRMALIYLGAIFLNPEEKKHSWKVETIKMFDTCHAETIYYLCNQNKKNLPEHTIKALRLSKLRKQYKSIYAKRNE
jgi:hypothetical protein